MGSRVVGVDSFGVDIALDDGKDRIAARTVLWAAGVQASPLAQQLADASGAEVDRAGRIATQPDLTLPGHPEVFVVGDMVTLDKLPGRRRGCHARRPARGEHDRPPASRR